jgi:PAS domain S-box-containing protein
MLKLKRLLILSALLLIIIISLNLVGYSYHLKKTQQKEDVEMGQHTSSYQAILIQQLSRKISVLSIHHYFSPDQYAGQLAEVHKLVNQLTRQEATLKNIIGSNSFSGAEGIGSLRSDFAKATLAYDNIQSVVAIATKDSVGHREEDYELQKKLRDNEANYLAAMQNINTFCRSTAKSMGQSINRIKDAMITSLVLTLLLLTALLVVPILKLNLKNYKELQTTLEEVRNAEKAIKESEKKYRSLFQANPIPMYIIDLETLSFLEVNERMAQHYGYSAGEFSRMNLLDIRPDKEKLRLQKKVAALTENEEMYFLGKWIHQKKNGEEIIVDIISHKILYQDKEALLVLANDITKNVQLQQELVEEKIARQRDITKATLSVQEKERNEIGKELHDNVNQILTTAKLHLELIELNEKEKHLQKGIELVSLSIKEIRRLSKSLVPPTLSDMGLIPAIEDLVENMNLFQCFSGCFVHKNFNEAFYDNDFKLTLFRIVQEHLTNIVKHAEASEAELLLEQTNNQVYLMICDNGKGFNKSEKRKGIGITNIINRADVFKGTVFIDTEPGKGCCLHVYFPINEMITAPC